MPCHNFYINRAYGKKDSTKHYVNVSYRILVQKIVRFLILWNIGKNFVENFITKQRVFLFTNQLTHTNFYIIYMQNNGWPSKRVVTLIISDNFEVYMSWMSTVRVVVFASGKLWSQKILLNMRMQDLSHTAHAGVFYVVLSLPRKFPP